MAETDLQKLKDYLRYLYTHYKAEFLDLETLFRQDLETQTEIVENAPQLLHDGKISSVEWDDDFIKHIMTETIANRIAKWKV